MQWGFHHFSNYLKMRNLRANILTSSSKPFHIYLWCNNSMYFSWRWIYEETIWMKKVVLFSLEEKKRRLWQMAQPCWDGQTWSSITFIGPFSSRKLICSKVALTAKTDKKPPSTASLWLKHTSKLSLDWQIYKIEVLLCIRNWAVTLNPEIWLFYRLGGDLAIL